jgi:tRNA (cmo5U34)-methyltransferase
MKKDKIFLQSTKPVGEFEFNAEVAGVFDDMLARSIPFYAEQQSMIRSIIQRLWVPGTKIYDLGCSTATTMIGLCRELPATARFVGYDNSPAMLDRARENIAANHFRKRIEVRHADLNGQLSDCPLPNASVVTMCWSLQFIRPLRRDSLIRRIYDSLVDEGVLIVTEKILTNDGNMNRFFIDLYYDFKRQNGYSQTEILRKREALENVLIPYRLEENLDLFRRNGFDVVETFFQWFNFAGFLCVKKPALASASTGRQAITLARKGSKVRL